MPLFFFACPGVAVTPSGASFQPEDCRDYVRLVWIGCLLEKRLSNHRARVCRPDRQFVRKMLTQSRNINAYNFCNLGV